MRKALYSLLAVLLTVAPGFGEQVVFSEIMYSPAGTKPEFIEISNITRTPLDFAKWRFTDGVTYEFPDYAGSGDAHILKPLERIVVSAVDPATTRTAYNIPAGIRIFGPWTGALNNAGERVTLTDKNTGLVCTVDYKSGNRWPKVADGTGHSLVLANENRSIDDYRVWRASALATATPGTVEPTPALPTTYQLRLSEIHYTGNLVDWVEVHNRTTSAIAVNGLFVASKADLSDKVALSGSVPANGYSSWNVSFPASASGEAVVYLADTNGNILATAEVQRAPGRDSLQAIYPVIPALIPSYEYVRTTPEWYTSASSTRNAANDFAPNDSIVITEIMFDPPEGRQDGEFIELHNKGAGPVSLTGWKMRGGIDFDFPAGASIPAGGYLTVARNKAYFEESYPGVAVAGEWIGGLGNEGDLIRLVDGNDNLADEVDYRAGGDWPLLASGQGSSMELLHPSMDNNRSSAWRASNESTKSTFQTYSVSGPYLQLRTRGLVTDYKELHLFLVGDSHVEIRNITVQQGGAGANLLTNSTVHALDGNSATGWLMQGTHWASYIEPGGLMHLIADGHGDNRPNRAEIDCTAMVQNTSYTIRFEARWVSGKPRLIVQTWDHSIGRPFLLPIPNNLGTPGAQNSAALATPAAQVDSVQHRPAVPNSSTPVSVTARIASANALTSVEVLHRASTVDNSLGWTSSPMFDNGTNGDAVPNDGVYTATLNQHQVNGRVVEFYVKATASGGGTTQLPRFGETMPAAWVVDGRTMSSTLRRQRFVVPLYNRTALTTAGGQSSDYQYDFPRLSNHYFNMTFITEERDVFYNAEIRKAGSPFTRSDASTLDRGKWKLPYDRLFRDKYKMTYDNDSGDRRHHNRIIRYWLYLLGHPVNENEYIHQVINTDPIAVREEVEPVGNDLLDRNFPDGNNGSLMRIDDEWWFSDDWTRDRRDADWSYKNTDATIRYHSEWMARSRESEYDYSALIEFFKTVSSSSATELQLNRVIDPHLTLMMAAVRGYAYDWDQMTIDRGKNGYLYRKITDGRWMFLHWDSDNAFGNASEVVVTENRAGWGNYIGRPWARRIFNNYLTELLAKYTRNSPRISAWMTAEEDASSAYTVNRTFYETWFTNREARCITEINTNNVEDGVSDAYTAPFNIVTPSGSSTTDATATLKGTAPSRAFTIRVLDHPEGVLTWENKKNWTITGVVLNTGVNTFTVQMLDLDGNVIGTGTFTITKTNNALPVIQLTSEPASGNVRLGETLILEAGTSFDPDQTPLTFAWTNTPTVGVTTSSPSWASRMAVFNTPGIYEFNLTATDQAGGLSSQTREFLAYNAADFSPMNGTDLESHWTVQNVEERNSFRGTTWYSTTEKPGSLLVQILDDVAKPFAFPAATHPVLTRPLPASADFALQTDLSMDTRQTGSFFTGLVLDTLEGGVATRYLFGLENGTNLIVRKSTGGSYGLLVSVFVPDSNAVLRIRRVGNQLRFQRRVGSTWASSLVSPTMAAGSTAVRGGVFASTSIAQSMRVAFDYVVVADTSNTTTVNNNLRITEMMYNPASPDTVEYIELKNAGTTTLSLDGVKFDDGMPFDSFTFPNETLAAGEYIVVTNNINAFRTRYGAGARVAGAWPGGALNNAGERVVLRDLQGNIIHDYTYDDVAPWPVSAKGGGPSLEVINLNGDYSDPLNWRASTEIGGSPGFAGIGPDSDGDGSPDSVEDRFGTGAANGGSHPTVTLGVNGSGQTTLAFPSVSGRQYRIEYRDDMVIGQWQTLTTVTGSPNFTSVVDTTVRPGQRFYRAVALP